jgi:hypothetical protein
MFRRRTKPWKKIIEIIKQTVKTRNSLGMPKAKLKPNIIIKDNNKYGAINSNRNTILETKYDYISALSDNNKTIFIVQKDGKYGIVNVNGEFILLLQYTDEMSTQAEEKSYSDGKIVIVNGTKWGLIDENGKFIINPNIESTSVPIMNDVWNDIYIDKNNNYYIPTGGYYDGGTGFINQDGTFVIAKQYWCGYATCRFDTNTGLAEVSKASRTYSEDDNLALSEYGEKSGIIDSKNNVIIPFEYGQIYILNRQRFIATDNYSSSANYWLINNKNEKINSRVYQLLRKTDYDNILLAQLNGNYGLIMIAILF